MIYTPVILHRQKDYELLKEYTGRLGGRVMKEDDIYYRCDVCEYLINFLQAKYAKFNILERCPRCHAGGFKLYYWESKESEAENDR